MRLSKLLFVVLGTVLAASAADDPFAGTWKLNVEKSKYHPGPPVKSETVAISADGTVHVDETSASGAPVSWSYTGVEGKEAPITGMGEDSSVIVKNMGTTVEHTWKLNGNPATGKGVISKDGKTMTYRIKGTNAEGKPMNNVLIFEKE